MEITYTIGVKGKFWPFFTKYRVKTHQLETQVSYKVRGTDNLVVRDILPRLVLSLADNSTLVIGAIEDKTWKVYPDFIDAVSTLKRAREAHVQWVDDSAPKRTSMDAGTSQSSSQQEPLSYLAQQLTPTQLQ